MKVSEIKKWIIEEMKKESEYIKITKDDKNPQVRDMRIAAQAKYDVLDELHFKIFHRFYKE